MLIDFQKKLSLYFKKCCRMSASDFELLLTKIVPSIQKQDTSMRKSISVKQRLAIASRFLPVDDSY